MQSVLFSSVFTNTGVARASGNSFKITNCTILVPRENRQTSTFQSEGLGLQQVELPVSDSCFDELHKQFQDSYKGLPVLIDVELSITTQGKNMITAVSPIKNAVPKPDTKPAATFG